MGRGLQFVAFWVTRILPENFLLLLSLDVRYWVLRCWRLSPDAQISVSDAGQKLPAVSILTELDACEKLFSQEAKRSLSKQRDKLKTDTVTRRLARIIRVIRLNVNVSPVSIRRPKNPRDVYMS